MQQLKFEASWDKAIAHPDRMYIEKIFEETKSTVSSTILFSPIKEAVNHKGELLVTVLVHNFTTDSLSFNNTHIVYLIEEKTVAEYDFTIPTFVVQPKTSMPWTFIFPIHKLVGGSPLREGIIQISELIS